MESTLTLGSSLFHLKSTNTSPSPSISNLKLPQTKSYRRFTVNASSSSSETRPLISTLKTTASAIVFSAAVFTNFPRTPLVKAEPPPPTTTKQQEEELQEQTQKEKSPLTQLLESSDEAIEAMKTLLQQKLEAGEDEEGLKILDKLSLAQPENTEWKFLKARLLNEMGQTQESREVFEEILSKTPLSFEALFENALLMDRCGEGEEVLKRLEKALSLAEEENKVKEARDVKLIMAQVQFLQKNVEEALRSYDELVKEDPADFRPYFCKGMIYSLLDRNEEAREEFAKYRELSPKKFEVEGYLRSPLSRMKLFGTEEGEQLN